MDNANEVIERFGEDLKILIVGNTSTGKTSIINRYINNAFKEKIYATILPEFSYKKIKKDNTSFRLHFWDIPGQDLNPIITGSFCRDAQGIIFCCEVKNKKSKEDILL